MVDGITFDSKREARYFCELKLRVMSGEVRYFLRQVPFDLPGNTKYRIDFMEVHANDESVHYIDVKGFETPAFRRSKKQVEALYPITIEVVK